MSYQKIRESLQSGMFIVAVGIVFCWIVWVTDAIFRRPTASEVDRRIRNEAPYVEDRRLILERLEESSASSEHLSEAIKNNTKAIVNLQKHLESK